MPPKLSVNIDHVATLRQSRGTPYPDPVDIAVLAQLGGTDGVTVHPREDRRHIQDRDVRLLKDILQVPLTLEMALTTAMVDFARTVQPFACTLVPEAREERTTESGMRVAGREKELEPGIRRLLDAGIRVSIFIDPDEAQVAASKEVGADAVEINTGGYADASPSSRAARLAEVRRSAEAASAGGLEVLAGHGLTYFNIGPVASIRTIEELNIGHSIISRASLVGLERAVREMVELLR